MIHFDTQGVEHTSICVGAYHLDNGDFMFDKIDTVEGKEDWWIVSLWHNESNRSATTHKELYDIAIDKCKMRKKFMNWLIYDYWVSRVSVRVISLSQ